jgi:hypothetical protein
MLWQFDPDRAPELLVGSAPAPEPSAGALHARARRADVAPVGMFRNSLDLAKHSWGVLRSDKELAAIPVASAVTCTAIALAFGGAAWFSLDRIADPAPGQDSFQATPLTWVVGIVGLLFVGIAAQYFAAVLIAGASERLAGGDPSLGSALAKANSRFGAIVGWAALNVTVGLILSFIRDRLGPLGDIATRLVGAAWNIVTWLAVPVILEEGAGPLQSAKRSAQLLRTTWGENVIGQSGLGLVGLLAVLPGLLVFGAVSFAIPLLGIPLLVIYLAIVMTIMAALGGIYRAALYRYAVGLPNGDTFPEQALAGAFRQKGTKATGLLR